MEPIGAPSSSSTSSSSLIHRSKCEFCEITFGSDLDVSRHLSSDIHSLKLNEYMALQNRQEKLTRLKVPKKIKEVFESLKIRDVRGLRELAAKGYFQMTDELQVDIAESLATSLFESLIEYECRKLPDGLREEFMAIVNEPDPELELEVVPEPSVSNTSTTYPSLAPNSSLSSSEEINYQPKPSTSRPTMKVKSKPEPIKPKEPAKPPHDPRNPQPRPDSDYIPKLAVIKIEPKD